MTRSQKPTSNETDQPDEAVVAADAPIADGPPESDDSPGALRYTGDGSTFFHGVERRDLTADEAQVIQRTKPALYAAMTDDSAGTPLYEPVPKPKN